jgi:hypothetical protein
VDGRILLIDRDVKPAMAGDDVARRLEDLKIAKRGRQVSAEETRRP